MTNRTQIIEDIKATHTKKTFLNVLDIEILQVIHRSYKNFHKGWCAEPCITATYIYECLDECEVTRLFYVKFFSAQQQVIRKHQIKLIAARLRSLTNRGLLEASLANAPFRKGRTATCYNISRTLHVEEVSWIDLAGDPWVEASGATGVLGAFQVKLIS